MEEQVEEVEQVEAPARGSESLGVVTARHQQMRRKGGGIYHALERKMKKRRKRVRGEQPSLGAA